MVDNFKYIGNELDLFSHVDHWKDYFASYMLTFVRGRVLEVGAGIGSSTRLFENAPFEKWLCLEPDPELASQLPSVLNKLNQPDRYQWMVGTLGSLPKNDVFDTILYIDVLEHIEDDRAEVEMALNHLSTDGALIVLSPAHQYLYSSFDKTIGHYRRYNKESLKALAPQRFECRKLIYLDSMGMLLSLGNRLILRKDLPSAKQLAFWDRYIVPISKRTDRLIHYRLGKSILAIWVNTNEQ